MIKDDKPALAEVFKALAALAFVAGLALCVVFWPSYLASYEERSFGPYMWSIVSIMAGTCQAAIFLAIGQALTYLHRIARSHERLVITSSD